MKELLLLYAPAAGALALLFALYLTGKVKKADPGNETMVEIAGHIQDGAMAFLNRQYRAIAVFVLAVFLILGFFIGWQTAICFLAGAIASTLAGYIGMNVATKANVRTPMQRANHKTLHWVSPFPAERSWVCQLPAWDSWPGDHVPDFLKTPPLSMVSLWEAVQ